jgi:tetratricopeptide (TPR) repeat protein
MACLFTPARSRALLLVSLLFPLLAAASEVDDIQKLMQKGAYKDALTLADKSIASKPRDANLRFLKGVLLAQMDRKQEAAAVFTALTQDFPQLAEPYNNLGVLLAASGELERAREVLERAVQVAPGYATAHENLGDLYARLSTQSYEKATQLDANNAKAKNKLVLARELSNAVAVTAPTAMAANDAALPPVRSPARQAIVVNGAQSPMSGKTAAPMNATGAAPGPDEKAVLDAVQHWAQAWSARDLKQYLASYAPDFRPAHGASLEAWKAERSKRIGNKGSIQVQVLQPTVRIEGDKARVKFIQAYEADQLKSRDAKELMLIRRGQDWLIQQEKVKG